MYLNCHSYYSLRYGTMSVEELVNEAKRLKISSIALTDINTSAGIVEFVQICNHNHINPIAGIEFRNKNQFCYIGIAKNNEGFRELNEWLSYHTEQSITFPARAPKLSNVYFIYSFSNYFPDILAENEYVGITPDSLNRYYLHYNLLNRTKTVILFPVTYVRYTDYEIHLHLRAIDSNTLLSKLTHNNIAKSCELFLPLSDLIALYSDFPYLKTNTLKLIEDCSIHFDFSSSKMKRSFTSSRYNDYCLLKKLSYEGMYKRYGINNHEARKRIRKELEIIDRMGFSAYFLIAWDIVRYAQSRNFYHVGRGSGANSIVAYCLNITNVDPIELNLYFERFINPKRSNPPDFDIDFAWNERDEVVGYIFKRYGQRYTAFLAAISTFKDRSIIRELGKVYGLPKEEIDLFLKNPTHPLCQNNLFKKIMSIGHRIADFPNIRSVHAGGILISELPLTYYTALDFSSKKFSFTHWDMYTAETIGFEKIDILSQRGIGHIKNCIEIIRINKGIEVNITDINKCKNDICTLEFLKQGKTLGCFYIESPAMRGLLKKLQCSDYRTLVAASSIIRPGVARSGMMKEYIRRYYNPSNFSYPHPIIKELLHETFGVMVYQEDVIKIAHYFAGLDLADADVLRRAMSGKYRSKKEFEKIAQKFFDNCHKKGYSESLIREIWRQMESFAGYSFSKAHSASYAVESFQSLYLKAHFPIEHAVAIINNFGGYYPTWVYVYEARKYGANIHLPCINTSKYLTILVKNHVYLGFVHVKQLETNFIISIEKERALNGNFTGLQNFIIRLNPSREQLIILIRIGAFRFTGKTKKELLWEAYTYTNKKPNNSQSSLIFDNTEKKFQLPTLPQNYIEDAYDEMELLDFVVSCHWVNLIQLSFVCNYLNIKFENDAQKCIMKHTTVARNMKKFDNKMIWMIGQLVTIKNVRTVQNQWMHMATFIDIEGEFFDTVHFPSSLKKYRFIGPGVYLVYGKITIEANVASMIVEKMAKIPFIEDKRYASKHAYQT